MHQVPITQSPTNLSRDRLLRRAEVVELTGFSLASLYRMMEHTDPEVRLPRPVKIGERAVRWSEAAILDWIERQKARGSAAA